MTLGENIARLRTRAGLSQSELAERLGVSRQSISKWETNTSIPELDKCIALSQLFSVSLDELVTGTEPAAAPSPVLQEAQSQPQRAPIPPDVSQAKTLGGILLGVGLLSVVLGLVFSPLLLILGGYLILCGLVFLLASKYHPGLLIGWGTFLPLAWLLPQFTGTSMLIFFSPYFYTQPFAWRIEFIVAAVFWGIDLLLILLTVTRTSLRAHPVLFGGWLAILPLPFRGLATWALGEGEWITPLQRGIGWVYLLLVAALAVATGRLIWEWIRQKKTLS